MRDAQQEELSKCEQETAEIYKKLEDLHEHTTKLFQLKADREALISKFMSGDFFYSYLDQGPLFSLSGSLRLFGAKSYD